MSTVGRRLDHESDDAEELREELKEGAYKEGAEEEGEDGGSKR